MLLLITLSLKIEDAEIWNSWSSLAQAAAFFVPL